MKLSIIVPVFNEEKTIFRVLKRLSNIDYGIPTEIIVINDGSTDESYNEMAKAKKKIRNLKLISYEQNKGKGFAVRKGMKSAKGGILIIQDGDLEYNPLQIPGIIRPILEKKSKVAYGSRFKSTLKNVSRVFLFGNKFLTFATNFLFSSSLSDMETCYKAIHRSILNGIKLKANRFELEAELTAKILRNGNNIIDVPIDYNPRNKGSGKKISIKDGIVALFTLFQVRLGLI
jgi:dolichol-phosphate mannosyltransferase